MRFSVQLVALLFYYTKSIYCTSNHRKTKHGNDHLGLQPQPRFSQAAEKSIPELLSFMFHPPVTPRALDIGLEDSNKGLLDAIKLNEDEEDVTRLLNSLEQREQNQVDSFYQDFQIQNAGLEEINNLISK